MLCVDFKQLIEDFSYLEELVFLTQNLNEEAEEINRSIRQKIYNGEQKEMMTIAVEELWQEYQSMLELLQSLDKILQIYSDAERKLVDISMCEYNVLSKKNILCVEYSKRLEDVNEVPIKF